MTHSTTESRTYTTADIEAVVRRFTTDIVMIASSTGAITEAKALDYAYDVDALTTRGYLRKVDLALLGNGVEIRATTYVVNTSAVGLTMTRPGGLLWPRVSNPHLQIVLSHTSEYNDAAQQLMKSKLRINWVPTTADTSHSTLSRSGSRDYASNGWGMQRTDFA